MTFKLYRTVLLVLRRFLPSELRDRIARHWINETKRLMADAEAMSSLPLSKEDRG